MVAPVRAELLATAADLGGRLAGGLRRLVERRKTELRAAARGLPQPEALLAGPRQRLDLAAQRLPSALASGLERRKLALSRLSGRLAAKSPIASLAVRRERLGNLEQRLANAAAAAFAASGTGSKQRASCFRATATKASSPAASRWCRGRTGPRSAAPPRRRQEPLLP